MRVLFHSNAPWSPTGYGDQVGVFAPRLAEHHELAVSAFYGLEGARLRWGDIPVFPCLGGDFGAGYVAEHCRRWFGGELRDGLLLTLLDVWVLDATQIAQLNAASWVPVDHDPVPPKVLDYFYSSGAVPLAMSRFGEKQLADADLDPLYVPHGIDVDALKPYPQAEVREETGVPKDAFLVGIVAANKGRNPSRKAFQQAFEAFAAFQETHDDAILYLHTVLDPGPTAGEDLRRLLRAYAIPPESVMMADQYRMLFDPLPKKTMARVYSCFDVLLNASMGEGFGVPIIEAQACGVPVVVTDFSSMSEVGGVGWRIEGRRFWTAQQSWQVIPDVDGIYSALVDAYEMPEAERRKMSKRARGHALNYSADKVMTDFFLPALQEVEERVGEKPALEMVA